MEESQTDQTKTFLPCVPEREDEMATNHQRQKRINNQFLHSITEKCVN